MDVWHTSNGIPNAAYLREHEWRDYTCNPFKTDIVGCLMSYPARRSCVAHLLFSWGEYGAVMYGA